MRRRIFWIGTGLLLSQMIIAEPLGPVIDPATLHRKVLCGYQGWFRAPGDPAGEGWRHWSRDSNSITTETLTFEMWPDMSEYDADERYPAPGFLHDGNRPADLFSSANAKTVDRHFRWMEQYGIDGVFLQRFLVHAVDASTAQVLANVRSASAKSGRVYAICYDLSGAPTEKLYDWLANDWRRLVDDQKITADANYLHHRGKPVVFVWGFFSDRFEPELAHRIIDLFKGDGAREVTLIGGCQWWWRTEKNPEWARAFRRLDVISPWNVGNVEMAEGVKHAATSYWEQDLAAAKAAGIDYLPVIYPGFGWTNLKGPESAAATIPRLGGEFFTRQFKKAAELNIPMAYVAMFDEVDEATAIFKVTNTPPQPGQFTTYEGLPPDAYLRLTGEGSAMIRNRP